MNPIWQLCEFKKPLILASTSPRRAAILKGIDLPFEVAAPKYDEEPYSQWDAGELLLKKAVQKAESVKGDWADHAILSADTIVLLNRKVFGKPRDAEEAEEMLTALSGRTHHVWSSLCYIPEWHGEVRTTTCRTKVNFRNFTDKEIKAYVSTGDPLDKAGGYGIQSIGGLWVQNIQGCYFNVVGLPLSQLWDLIRAS
ncbi:septum formation protein Maf [candidate division LCP-89 bacterium B3_LCP]|uniref:dTTP/UTP pyrophosphatase n=1 Tax=candidate division LCP-89 bacterium B3_LCP TaxID=2012998 RepID=A0A532V1J1_UNCL8|nr:MAG: septum formation protein Maf [candidate division LCP-89 bacterium B3_LCP]